MLGEFIPKLSAATNATTPTFSLLVATLASTSRIELAIRFDEMMLDCIEPIDEPTVAKPRPCEVPIDAIDEVVWATIESVIR